jgi:hypothetical protein
VSEAQNGQLVWREALDYVVYGDIARATDEDAEIQLDKLQDELDQSVSFASLVEVSHPDG